MRGSLAAALLALAAAGCGERAMTFDSAAWAAERGNFTRPSRRGHLAGGLTAAGVVAGARRDAVRAVLGEPDATDPGQDIYFLGRSDYAPDVETLHIAYDAAGIVTRVGRRQG